MDDYLDIKSFIDELEVCAKQKLNYPAELGELLQIVMKTGMKNEFEDLIFQAKFLLKIQEIMKRIGPGVNGFEKLSTEFQSSIRKSAGLLHMIAKGAPSDVSRKLVDTFNIEETDSFNQLMKLFSDLSWIKNWQIDGKPLPYETKLTTKSYYQDKIKEYESEPFARIQKSALFIAILFILFLFVDSPVTVIGWILLLGIAIFLVYIIIQIHIIKRTQKNINKQSENDL